MGKAGKNCPFFLHDNKSSRLVRTFLMLQDYRDGMMVAIVAFFGIGERDVDRILHLADELTLDNAPFFFQT
jgi:hypothetical protein